MNADGLPTNPKIAPPWATRNRNEVKAILKAFADLRMESLRLYEPLPFQDAYHRCTLKECILMKGTRVGGSLAGFVEDARAALGCDPYDKYPKKDGNIICLGYGEPHVGRVIHRLLFRPGAFTIIPDLKTKDWRVFRPWPLDEQRGGHWGDQGREKETMPAPPLIPARRIKGRIAWVKRAHYVFHRVDLDTGWSIFAANSAGDPKQVQGFDVHLYHIDEDLATNGWYLEASSRTQMVEGKLRWTALPHGENDDLLNLVKRAEDQQDDPNKISIVLRATMYDNPYMSDKTKKELEVLWRSAGEDVYRQRALGDLSTESTKMYPTFNTRIHGYKTQKTDACKQLQERSGQVPNGWTRYMVVDPGHTICAVLFIAVPPPSVGDHVYFYDECYIAQATAAMFGASVERKTNVAPFQAFIIDAHGGALRELGSGMTPREQYSNQLAQRGIRSVETQSEFLSGCDHMEGRENALREWLRIREDGSTKLIVNTDQCPNFCREMETFKKKYVLNNGNRIILNEGNRRAGTHLVECAEYSAAHGCRYVAPPKSVSTKTWVERMLDDEKSRKARFRVINGVGNDRTINLGPQGVEK